MKYLLCIGWIVLSLLVYFPTFGMYFLSDDFIWLYEAKQASVSSLATNYINADSFFYRPTTKAYFFFMYRIFGMQQVPYHVLQVMLHGIMSFLVYLIVVRTFAASKFKEQRHLFAYIVGLLFLLHPIQTEVVIWISAITELIPALCIAGAMVYAAYLNDQKKSIRLREVLFLSMLYILAVGGHEYAIVMPGVLYLWLVYIEKTPLTLVSLLDLLKKQRVLWFSFFFVFVCYLTLRYVAQAHWQGGDYSYDLVKLPFNVVGNFVSYVIFSLVGPVFYDYYFSLRIFLRAQLFLVSSLIGISMIFLYVARRAIDIRTFIIWTGMSVLLLGAFLPLGTIAERYVYFVSFIFYLFAVVAVWLFCKVVFRKTILREFMGIGVFFVGFFYIVTLMRFQEWHTASAEVVGTVGVFAAQCESYNDGQYLEIDSPVNRIGRAWVFQVGVEEAASLICNKELRVIRVSS